ncbi:MAG TPA: hypothetical protein VEC99_11980, partial [Clostridia bacterium]|nr:hypothetical protein [Clostridia bacterium]
REVQCVWSLLAFAIAMGLHFLVNDYGLNRHHQERYRGYGRWVLAAAVLLGWAVGLLVEVSRAAVVVLFAFLAGGVIMNVMKEEVPETQQSRFWPFAAGAVFYAAFLLMVGTVERSPEQQEMEKKQGHTAVGSGRSP